MKLWGLCFWDFKDCLKIYVMYVNVDMCKAVLIAGESTDYEFSVAIFIELLKFFCEVLSFRIHAYVWWRIRGTISQEERDGGEGSPLPIFENWKNCPNNSEKCFDCAHV